MNEWDCIVYFAPMLMKYEILPFNDTFSRNTNLTFNRKWQSFIVSSRTVVVPVTKAAILSFIGTCVNVCTNTECGVMRHVRPSIPSVLTNGVVRTCSY